MNEGIGVPPYMIAVQNHQCQITLTGDLTATMIPDLQPALRSVLDQGASELVFDLTNAVMLDSSGIGLLIAAANTDGSAVVAAVSVTNVSAEILRLLQMMRLVDRLHVTGRLGRRASMDDELLGVFVSEAREHLATIEADLLAIEEGGAERRQGTGQQGVSCRALHQGRKQLFRAE